MVDIATRVHNRKWKIDPIIRSLLDTDFYKLLMCQSVFKNKPNTRRIKVVGFGFKLYEFSELQDVLGISLTVNVSRRSFIGSQEKNYVNNTVV
jgi:nicotinic acid phosphoribosyltransferase